MSSFLSALLLAAPLTASAIAPAQAQMWNSTYQQIGPNGYGHVTGPGGYRGTY
jgi:hypothetical protein